MMNLYRIETEDRWGRMFSFELKARSKAEAYAIADRPEYVENGSVVTGAVQISKSQYDDGWGTD